MRSKKKKKSHQQKQLAPEINICTISNVPCFYLVFTKSFRHVIQIFRHAVLQGGSGASAGCIRGSPRCRRDCWREKTGSSIRLDRTLNSLVGATIDLWCCRVCGPECRGAIKLEEAHQMDELLPGRFKGHHCCNPNFPYLQCPSLSIYSSIKHCSLIYMLVITRIGLIRTTVLLSGPIVKETSQKKRRNLAKENSPDCRIHSDPDCFIMFPCLFSVSVDNKIKTLTMIIVMHLSIHTLPEPMWSN